MMRKYLLAIACIVTVNASDDSAAAELKRSPLQGVSAEICSAHTRLYRLIKDKEDSPTVDRKIADVIINDLAAIEARLEHLITIERLAAASNETHVRSLASQLSQQQISSAKIAMGLLSGFIARSRVSIRSAAVLSEVDVILSHFELLPNILESLKLSLSGNAIPVHQKD